MTCPEPEGAFYVYPSIAGLIGRTAPGRHAHRDRRRLRRGAARDRGRRGGLRRRLRAQPELPDQLRRRGRRAGRGLPPHPPLLREPALTHSKKGPALPAPRAMPGGASRRSGLSSPARPELPARWPARPARSRARPARCAGAARRIGRRRGRRRIRCGGGRRRRRFRDGRGRLLAAHEEVDRQYHDDHGADPQPSPLSSYDPSKSGRFRRSGRSRTRPAPPTEMVERAARCNR